MNFNLLTLLSAVTFGSIAHAAATPSATEIAELNVLMNDVSSHLTDYMVLALTPGSSFSLTDMPAGILDIGLALATATDKSYTTLYSEVDFAGVQSMITKLPWYSTRLEPEIISAIVDASN
ncbi:SRP1/TIP1 family protein NDAI_0J02580 [Naumovozyma dairenensis CBS 421]|uniref:Uncharacterized protein n=1 Tax=Naumovozyma dairenensis (strain ATCC 10597 / BCRC 20456 / CBS 421 / NBRC 0211 / NRRL Y-12639) TaxID=1071378 RepID=G0WH72_NAUDC|nr:hypothetical protein NDAI_0J02580 [Naumovozyma dairenensis CBS 421]CCD27150.1 hypothetical protein NDAI_0J02580 [Naumovozyma dairenensis CBS 421]